MKILLISSTYKETEAVLKTFETLKCFKNDFYRGFVCNNLIDLLVTGVGAVATAESISRRLVDSTYDLVLNVGICGSFKKEYPIGSVVLIGSETWGDLGAEDHDEFLDLFDLGFLKQNVTPYIGKSIINKGNVYSSWFSHIPEVKGITINTAHGNRESIEKCIQKYNPDVESMESAAVFSFCNSHSINFQCLRSISNFVEPRNRSSWEIEAAIKNLTLEVARILNVIRK
jgi:futalosine hydrolase